MNNSRKKVLMAATVPSMIGQFNMDNLRILQDMGYEVHVACDFTDRSVWTTARVQRFIDQLDQMKIHHYQIDFARTPLKLKKHLVSYIQLKKLFRENHYAFVHCHTPVASVICRIVAHQKRTKCIYTAHGFHFYNGAPWKNWLIFYPIEKFLSKWTDVLITINREDYLRATTKFHAKNVQYIPGVGIDMNRFVCDPAIANAKRTELGLSDEDIMLVSVGELSSRKNHESVIRAIKMLDYSNIKYFICGKGELEEHLRNLIHELDLTQNVILLGYRNDIKELCHAGDLFVFPSHQEGLPVALMEAIACKMPVICSKIRGNTDLVQDYMFDSHSVENQAILLKKITKSRTELHKQMQKSVEANYEHLKAFDLSCVSGMMRKLYEI